MTKTFTVNTTYLVFHIHDDVNEYLLLVDENLPPKTEDWCVELRGEKTAPIEFIKPFHKTLSSSWVAKIIAHRPLYGSKQLDGVPLLPEPTSTHNCVVEMDINTLYKVFNSGFNLGSNEGPFPKNGTFNVFHNTIEGKPMSEDDNSFYHGIKNKIKIKSIPTQFVYEGESIKDGEIILIGKYKF